MQKEIELKAKEAEVNAAKSAKEAATTAADKNNMITASLHNYRISPRKVRVAANLVRANQLIKPF